jgi:hypothetical protein
MSNTRLQTGLLGVGVVLLMAAPIAYSQNLPKGPSPVVEDGSRLSGAEQITKSKKRKAAIDDYLKQMEILQEQAKKAKDLVRIDCINSKISETRDLLALVTPAMSILEQAVKDDDSSKRLREYTKISLSHDRTEQLLNEAKTCAGETVTYAGETITEVEIDGEIPDPTEPGLGELPVDRPTDFSPLQ